MYQGKGQKTFLKKISKSPKSMALLTSFLLLTCVTVGGTVALLADTTGTIVNRFSPSEVTTEVVETLGEKIKSDVKIQNTGDTEAYIRAAVVVTWQDEAGNVYGQLPTACEEQGCEHSSCGNDYAIDYDLLNGWKKGPDGFFYWTKPVNGVLEEGFDEADEKTLTGVLIKNCQPLEKTPADGYYLNVEIIGSGIQSKPANAVVESWSSGVSSVGGNDGITLQIKTASGTAE